jgi:hypothetical protein
MQNLSTARAALAGAVIVACCSVAMAADPMPSGSMIMVMPDGKTATMPMPDPGKVEMMLKGAHPMNDEMIILVWGAKTYMLKNEKMSDGRMSFDAWGLHFDK